MRIEFNQYSSKYLVRKMKKRPQYIWHVLGKTTTMQVFQLPCTRAMRFPNTLLLIIHMHSQLPPIVLDVPTKSVTPGESPVASPETRRLQLLAYLTAKDDPIRPPGLPIEAMLAGGKEATPLKLNTLARKEVEQTVACEEDDNEGIENVSGDDGHDYETNEGGANGTHGRWWED